MIVDPKNYFTCSDIRKKTKDSLDNNEFVIDKTGCQMIELPSLSFIADEDAIFGTVNQDYVQREIEWYKSMSLNVNDIPGKVPEIWKNVADKDGFINSNYGYCIYHEENGLQYENVVKELQSNLESRRAIMIYQRPDMWKLYNLNGRSDFCCTNAHQYLYRDNKLHAFVDMRSCDIVFGYKNDRAWADYVLTQLCTELHLEKGYIVWNATSLHLYQRHFHLIK